MDQKSYGRFLMAWKYILVQHAVMISLIDLKYLGGILGVM